MDNQPAYVLSRDMYSSIRLNLQHFLWKDGLGYLIHPSVPLTGTNCRIAGLGTGTGIWLLDLAKQLPDTTQLHGFDVADSQFPHAKYLPQNVTLHVLDCLNSEPPIELQETFDIVHLRLWLGVVPNGDPTALLRHALKLLRPNGEQSPYVAKVLTLIQEIRDHSRWIERLPELFKQFGLENIENEFAFEQPWQSKIASDMSCAVAHEMENNGSPFLTKKIKTIGVSVPLAYSEVSKGARVVQPFRE
ncbi:UMTA methyltransferase family protein [Rutstroemia sp. NJR-2017a BVV2]|nr:UMTA methyltransferase family protein [Rutstroemia sp. NJR-2017a BVV2]